MLLPSRPPAKLKPRVDFDPEQFRKMIFTRGLRVRWEQSAECPCERQTQAVNQGFGFDVQSGLRTTAEARVDCPVCKGRGYFHHSSQEILAVIPGSRNTPKPFEPYGEHARGMVSVSLLPEHLPALYDRFTLLDSVLVYRESKTRSAVVESLRYPIVSRSLDLQGGAQTVDVLYAHKASASGSTTSVDTLTQGVDFVITNAGEVDWTLGDGLGSAPVVGAQYSFSYYANPRYVVIDHPHAFRDTWIGNKVATPYAASLPVQAMAQLDFLGGSE